jgi:hypothetical protein
MTFSEGQPADVAATEHAGSGLSSSEPVFSELIDRWLRDGERLHEVAGAPDPTAPGDSPTQLDGWKVRARELVGTVIERHRLELLVGIGLVPLALFLLVTGHSARENAPPRAVAAQATRPAAPPRPAAAQATRPAPARPRTVLAEPPVTVVAPRAKPAPAPAPAHAKPVTIAKRPPARPAQLGAPTSRPAPAAPSRIAKAPLPPSAPRPAVIAAPKILPPRPPAGTKVAVKTSVAPDPRVAPNLKLGSATRRP